MPSTASPRRGRKSRDFQERRERFDTAWQGTATPEIERFLPPPETAAVRGYSRRQLLVELVEIDLESRWKTGFPRSHFESTEDRLPSKPRIEDYVTCFPELGSSDDLPLDLVVQEYKVRCESGDAVEHEEYFSRFPAHADRLRGALRDADTNMTEPTARFVRCPQCHSSIAVPDLTFVALEVVTCACGEKIPIVDERAGDWREGQFVGDYQLIRWLGRGSFANVWLAFDHKLERHVALKIPYSRRKKGERPDLIRNEARTVAGLKHANIVQVYELGQGENEYIASEYIKGQNLETSLRISPRAPEDTAALCRKMADALHYLHGRGVVHRDVKPSNILLDEYDEPHLTDFGLALREGESIVLSSAGELIGTVAYMSPKQAAGKGNQADARSDVFSLGIVMYEMLAGTLPFHGDRLTIVNKIQCEDPVSILKQAPNTPRDLQTICFKCLEKDPEKRYETAGALADDLGRYLRGEPIHARPATRRERLVKWAKRHPARAIAAGTSTVAAAAIVVAIGLGVLRHIEDKVRFAELRGDAETLLAAVDGGLKTAHSEGEIDNLYGKVERIEDIAASDERLADWQHEADKCRSRIDDKSEQIKRIADANLEQEAVNQREVDLTEAHTAAMARFGALFFVPDRAPSAAGPNLDAPATRIDDLGAAPNFPVEASAFAGQDDEGASTSDDEVDSPTAARPALKAMHVPLDTKQARQEALEWARRGLEKAGVYYPPDTAPVDRKPLWTAVREVARKKGLLGMESYDATRVNDEVREIEQRAYELVLLYAELTFGQHAGRTAEAALSYVDEATTVSPPTHAYYRLRERYVKALPARTSALASLSNDAPPTTPTTHFDFFIEGSLILQDCVGANGGALIDRSKWSAALAQFEKSFDKNPDYVWTQYFLALCQARLGDPKAEMALTHCVHQMPEFPWAFVLRGMSRHSAYLARGSISDEMFNMAAADYGKALKLVDPRSDALTPKSTVDETATADRIKAGIYLNLGALYFDGARGATSPDEQQRRLDEAARFYEAALPVAENTYWAHWQLALVRASQGRNGDAVAEVAQALATAPASAKAGLYFDRGEFHLTGKDAPAAAADFALAAEAAAETDQRAVALVQQAWTLGFGFRPGDWRSTSASRFSLSSPRKKSRRQACSAGPTTRG